MIMKVSNRCLRLAIPSVRRFAVGYKNKGLPLKSNASDNDDQHNSLI